LQSLYEQFNHTLLEKNLSIQQYTYKLNEINSRINTAGSKFDINQIKSRILSNLSKFYQHFRTTYYLINQDIAVVNLINLLIQKEQSKKLQELNKKEKINTIITNQTDGNRNNNQNTNQNTNKRDKCDTYKCKHDEEYIIKKDMIPKDWQGSEEIKKRL
jgi:hypothetical protein